MNIDTRTMSPWAPTHMILSNMKTLKVKVGRTVLEGDAELTEEDGHVTLAFAGAPRHKEKVGKKARKK